MASASVIEVSKAGAPEIHEQAEKWPGTLASACRQLAEHHLDPTAEPKPLAEMDRAALGFVLRQVMLQNF